MKRYFGFPVDSAWLLAQFIMPVIGPIFIAALIALLWSAGDHQFVIRADVILDVTPRALTFYNLVLIVMTLGSYKGDVRRHAVMLGSTAITGVTIVVFHAFTVIWRHDAIYVPNLSTYLVSALLTLLAVFFSHWCHINGLEETERSR